ncbi:MAG: DoxX family membrane protein [Acidobacteriota bacterium]
MDEHRIGRHADVSLGNEAGQALAVLRLTLGALFVWVFFENLHKGLYTPEGYAQLINVYLTKGSAPGAWKQVMRLAAEHAAVAAPLQEITELSFGVLLTLGLFTRLVAVAAGLFLASLWISEWGTAWIWELLVPIVVAFALAYGRAGRVWGLDGPLARRLPRLPL